MNETPEEVDALEPVTVLTLTPAERRRQWREKNKDTLHANNQQYLQDLRERTLATAENRRQPWSEAEDDLLLTSKARTQDLAIQLGRTYGATNTRRYNLRKALREAESTAAQTN